MVKLFQDIVRILSVTENLLYLAGKSLQRRAMRNGVLISLAFSSTILRNNYINAQELSPEQLTALVLGAFASYPAGTILVRIANFLTRDNLQAAAAGYLHLTSHYKQSEMIRHLHYLWHEVFAEEIPIVQARENSPGAQNHFPIKGPESTDEVLQSLFQEKLNLSEQEYKTYTGFVQTAADALGSPLPMGVQSARLGFHLGPIEDWYEKGFFSYEDFPAKAISRDPLIKRCLKLTSSATKYHFLQWVSPEATPSFWYSFTVRKFGTQVGRSLNQLNQLAERQGFPDFFDAQHFVWPSKQLDETVKQRFNSQDNSLAYQLFNRRQILFANLFGKDSATARRHIMRMFARDYAFIMKLRLAVDVYYAANKLNASPAVELQQIENLFSINPVKDSYLEHCRINAVAHINAFNNAIREGIQANLDRVTLENLQLANHLDFNQLRASLLGEDYTEVICHLNQADSKILADLAVLRELLHRVRIYHVLIKLQIHAYCTVVLQLGDH